jgi:hypothetical protein
MSSYTFVAVKTAADVTDVLNNNKASKARVAAVGQDDTNAKFNVWYETGGNHTWTLTPIDFKPPPDDTDTDMVRTTLDGTDIAAVTFYGQDKKYYVWWLKKH